MGNYLEACLTWVERLEMKAKPGQQSRVPKDCALIRREREVVVEELHCEEACEQEEEGQPLLETEGRCVKASGVEEAEHVLRYLYLAA
jgi:hypothetical protein